MGTYVLSELAQKDIADITKYTVNKWGYKNARRYLEKIDLHLQKLSQTPQLGRDRAELYPCAKSYLIEKHIAFYTKTEYGIFVARVLHQKMDVVKHVT